jgi:hypothetical protein
MTSLGMAYRNSLSRNNTIPLFVHSQFEDTDSGDIALPKTYDQSKMFILCKTSKLNNIPVVVLVADPWLILHLVY